jgi:hypothetical protein
VTVRDPSPACRPLLTARHPPAEKAERHTGSARLIAARIAAASRLQTVQICTRRRLCRHTPVGTQIGYRFRWKEMPKSGPGQSIFSV